MNLTILGQYIRGLLCRKRTNFRDHIPVRMVNCAPGHEGEVFFGGRGDSVCVTCSKKMPKCWDTVCAKCWDTSCYDHSFAIDGKWLCVKCAPVGAIPYCKNGVVQTDYEQNLIANK